MLSKRTYEAPYFFLAILLFFAVLSIILHFFSLPFIDYGKFLLGLLFIVYIPGQTILWLTKLKLYRFEMVTLSLVLGMATSTLVYRISGIINFIPLFFLYIAIFSIIFIFRIKKTPPKKEDFNFSINWVGIVFILIALLVLCVLSLDNYRNGIRQPDGSILLNMHYLDGFVRNAVVRELSHSIPPQMPFAAGLPLSYHYGMDLFISIFYKHLNIDVLHLLHRLTITFFFAILMMSCFVFVRKWTNSDKAGLLSLFLVLFGSGGFGYIGGLLTKYSSYWGKMFYSFYFLDLVSLNSFLPSLSVLLAGFFCLLHYVKSRKAPWLILAAFFLAVVADFKISYAAPVIGALTLTGLVYILCHKEMTVLKVLLMTGVMLTPLILLAYFHNQNGPQYVPWIRFNNWIVFSLTDLKLHALKGPWLELTRDFHPGFSNILLSFPIICGFFLGSFGLSFIALPGMIRKFFRVQKEEPMRFFLTSFFLLSIIYFFFISTVLGGRPRNWTNIYIYYLSVILLIFFLSEQVIQFLEIRKKAVQIILISLVILFSVPNVIQFLWAKIHYPQPRAFSQSYIEICNWLNKHTLKDSVIIHNSKLSYVCYFTDRRVVLDSSAHSYLTFHMTTNQIKMRVQDVERFMNDPVLNADALEKYNVSYVLVINDTDFLGINKNEENRLDCFSFLGGKKVRKYFRSHFLNHTYKNKYYSIYKVNAYPKKHREVYVLNDGGDKKRTLIKFSDLY